MNIIEDDKEYLITAEMPEVKRNEVKVTVENNTLIISGERKFEKEEKGKKYHRVERAYGSFVRSFTLPHDADANKVIPERGDHRPVQWAATAHLWQVLEHGCRVWMNPEPFDHSKLLLVDAAWVTFGSANWDARSLRLNFEFNVECYSSQLGGQLEQLFLERRARRQATHAGSSQFAPIGGKTARRHRPPVRAVLMSQTPARRFVLNPTASSPVAAAITNKKCHDELSQRTK